MALHKFRQSRSYRLDLELESQVPSKHHNKNGVSFSSKPSEPSEPETHYNNNNYNYKYCLNRLLFPHNAHILSSSSSSSSSSSWWLWRIRTTNFLWIASTVFIIYFGDSRTNLVALLASDPRIHRVSFYLGLLCLVCNLGIFLYLSLHIHTIKKVEKLQLVANDIIPIIVMVGLLTFILFTHALWPIWGFLVLPMQITFFMAFGVTIAPYTIPHINS